MLNENKKKYIVHNISQNIISLESYLTANLEICHHNRNLATAHN